MSGVAFLAMCLTLIGAGTMIGGLCVEFRAQRRVEDAYRCGMIEGRRQARNRQPGPVPPYEPPTWARHERGSAAVEVPVWIAGALIAVAAVCAFGGLAALAVCGVCGVCGWRMR